MNCGDGATRASLPTVINQTFLFDCRERRPRRSCKLPCDLLKFTTLPNRGTEGVRTQPYPDRGFKARRILPTEHKPAHRFSYRPRRPSICLPQKYVSGISKASDRPPLKVSALSIPPQFSVIILILAVLAKARLKIFIFKSRKKKKSSKKLLFLVPATGLEPVRFLRRGILSPLCLPIPPRRHFFITQKAV